MLLGNPIALRRPAAPELPAFGVIFYLVLVIFGVAALGYAAHHDVAEAPVVEETSAVYFTPGGSPTKAVVEALRGARQSVHLQAYSFTSAPIAHALVDAEKRGVAVTAILDQSNRTARYSTADFLAHAGVPIYLDAKHGIAHNKIILVDGRTVITGSFNFTKAAQENDAENLLVLHDSGLARQYEENWRMHLAHAEPYAGR